MLHGRDQLLIVIMILQGVYDVLRTAGRNEKIRIVVGNTGQGKAIMSVSLCF